MNDRIAIQAKIELATELFQASRQVVKSRKLDVETAKADKHRFGMYDDCGDFYRSEYDIAVTKLDCAIDERIRLEKTMRFYKHRLTELQESN